MAALIGQTVRRAVALDELPRARAQEWRSVLGSRTLQAIDGRAQASAERTRPDSFCYGVTCSAPPTDVQIPEQHLPDHLRQLFDGTLREDPA